MAGFPDYLRFIMGWWSSPLAAVIVDGPYCFHEGVAYVPDGSEGVTFTPGGVEGVAACQD